MVKAGKFSKRGFSWATSPAAIPYGANSPEHKIWFGPIRKTSAAAATMTVNLRGATWGFTWIDYAELHSRPHNATTNGMAIGTVFVIVNHNPTLWLPITLTANQTRCFALVVGRTSLRAV